MSKIFVTDREHKADLKIFETRERLVGQGSTLTQAMIKI